MSEKMLNGSCLCGACKYAVPDAFEYAMTCHCSQCRRATGSAFKAFAGIRVDQLRLETDDGELLTWGDDTGHDVHCRHCGSLLYSVVREHQYVHVTLGTLVDVPGIRPAVHIFVGSKAPWYEINDDLPQFDEYPG